MIDPADRLGAAIAAVRALLAEDRPGLEAINASIEPSELVAGLAALAALLAQDAHGDQADQYLGTLLDTLAFGG